MKDGISVSIGQEYTFLKLSGIYRIYDGVEAETRKCHARFQNISSYERLAEHQTYKYFSTSPKVYFRYKAILAI